MNMANFKTNLIELLFFLPGCVQVQAQDNKIVMAHKILHDIAMDGDFATSFSLLEQDARNTDCWHEQLLGFCKNIYSNDSIPDKELAFADRTLEALASSPRTPKTVVANACVILGNIAFNARDCAYLDLNIQRLQQAAATLAPNRQLDQTIHTLQQRREIIREYTHGFKERMQGTWVSAEVGQFLEPLVFIDIMPDSIRKNPAIAYYFHLKMAYDSQGRPVGKYQYPQLGTKEIVISPEERKIAAFFGYSKLDKGNQRLAAAVAQAGNQWSGAMTRSIAVRNRKKPDSAGAAFASFSSELSGAMAQGLAKILSETVNYTSLDNFYLTEIVPGIVRLDREDIDITESSQKGTSEEHNFQSIYLYKISPADSLVFTRQSPEKFKQPYVKDLCAYPYDVDDVDTYLRDRNREVTDSIQQRPQGVDEVFDKLSGGYKYFKAACYANHYMTQRLTRMLQKRLDAVPEALLDETTRRDIQTDLDFRSKYQDIFHKDVLLRGFGELGDVSFKGVYRIRNRVGLRRFLIYFHEKPASLAKMQWGELPPSKPKSDIDTWLSQLVDPMEGTLKWEKKNKQYMYEGQIKDRKFDGYGKLWEDNVLIHEGEFKDGKPVK